MKKLLIVAASMAAFLITACQSEGPKTQVVAHRGYWDCEGSAQNSIAAITKAGEIGCYGSEFDVSMTSDGILVVNHDDVFHGIVISENEYALIKDSLLKNGEPLPTLESYLDAAAPFKDLKLVFELKSYKGDSLYEETAARKSVEMLREKNLLERTEFISFSFYACELFAKMCPDNMVEYLGCDKAPADVLSSGIKGIDYEYNTIYKHPEWVEEAHNLGMIVNAWTVNKEPDIKAMIGFSVDYITTNKPLLTAELIAAWEPEEK